MPVIQVPFESAETLGATLPLQIPDSCKLLRFEPRELPALTDPGAAVLEARAQLDDATVAVIVGRGADAPAD